MLSPSLFYLPILSTEQGPGGMVDAPLLEVSRQDWTKPWSDSSVDPALSRRLPSMASKVPGGMTEASMFHTNFTAEVTSNLRLSIQL